ncbi:hypothetical protein U4E84_09320 [Halorubrum sp. AD140]|uniref:hypothetical protein n=1 Tax=Halorubrum sp. AD140 TaxID=3050073 RepID=UPI002ACCC61B|nr:hypothetical protein [Halorubrum sp. AD140]MDZ5811543.1 hypothetical protein [Halorubrum sp. AD140]
MKLERDTVYEHKSEGAVLVVGIHHVFSEYDTAEQDGELSSRVVQYTDEWDDYGPMPSSTRTAPIDDFADLIGEPVETVEFERPE